MVIGKCSHGQQLNRVEINDSTITRLNGDYLLFSTDSSSILPSCLLNDFHFNWENLADSNDYLRLEVLNQRKIKIGLYENGKLIKTKTIKGQLVDGVFISRPLYINPFYLLIFGTAKYNFRLGINTDNYLIVDGTRKSKGFFILIPFIGNKTEFKNAIFNKKGSS